MTRPIDLLRLGNPWLVGSNVNRIVPVYVTHNFLAPNFVSSNRLQAVKDLVFNSSLAVQTLSDVIKTKPSERKQLERTAAGVFSPDRRLFRSKETGGALRNGSAFPILAGLVKPDPSDDGLGGRLRTMLQRSPRDWQQSALDLFRPSTAADPATQFAMNLLGDEVGGTCLVPKDNSSALSTFDDSLARFVETLLDTSASSQRLAAIRDLMLGLYFAAVLRMVSGPAFDTTGKLPLVFVFGDLPPGSPGEPVTRAASNSFERWTAQSWRTTWMNISKALVGVQKLPSMSPGQLRRYRIDAALKNQGAASVDLGFLDGMDFDSGTDDEFCEALVEHPSIKFTQAEMARRVRSLAANIGLAGPDRGTGNPRLVLDTPLLGVLVRGVLGRETMEFRRFVTELADRFGLVIGPGLDEVVIDRAHIIGSSGTDPLDVAFGNQERFRQRLIRVGLARAYSDSHTEVLANA